MKKALTVIICIVLASCASTNRPPTIAELVVKTYPAYKYMSQPHPIADSAVKARQEAFFDPSK